MRKYFMHLVFLRVRAAFECVYLEHDLRLRSPFVERDNRSLLRRITIVPSDYWGAQGGGRAQLRNYRL